MQASRDIEGDSPLFSPALKPAAAATRPAGFTLVEILVSLTLLTIIVLLLGQMLGTAGRAWNSIEANKERLQNVRAISEFICAEMRTALLPVNRQSQSSLQFVVDPPCTSGSLGNRDAVFWQVSLASNQTLGDVAEVGYFVQWNTDHPKNPTSQLCRFFVNPATSDYTPDPHFLIGSAPSAWLTEEIIKDVAPASRARSYNGLFAENVMGLWVQCLDSEGQPITKAYDGTPFGGHAFDSRLGYLKSDGTKTEDYTDASGNKQPLCALPSMVDLGFIMLDSNSAAKIGPAQQAAIQTLTAASTDTEGFLQGAQAAPELKAIRSGLRPYQTRIYLQNSK